MIKTTPWLSRATRWRNCAGNGATESAARYAELRQLEAKSRIRDLEKALEQLKLLDQRRGETWRGAVHDVRGSFGVIKNISDQLGDEETDASLKAEFLSLLQKSVGSLHALLNNLLVSSRLEAGQERRDLGPLDAALVLKELCDSFQALAGERVRPNRLRLKGVLAKGQLHLTTPCCRSDARRFSTRLRLTPKSLRPRRAAERTAITFCAARR